MKCVVCGNELKEGAKFCSKCGNVVQKNPVLASEEPQKECPRCHKLVASGKKFCKYCGWDTTKPFIEIRQEPEPVKKKKSILPKLLIALFVILLLAVIGFFGYKLVSEKLLKNDSSTETTSESAPETSTKSEDDSPAVNNTEPAVEEASTEEATTEKEEVLPEVPQKTMNYVNNATCDIDHNLTSDAFERVTSDDGLYYFSYPKYLFNNFSYSEKDGYYFSYVDNGETLCSMQVYVTDEPTNDPISYMANKQNELKALYPSTDFSKSGQPGYGYYFPAEFNENSMGSDSLMQIVLSGWADTNHTKTVYYNVASDGEKCYYLKFCYPDYDSMDDYENWDYVANNIYRMASFSGSTKEPFKTYEDFRE